jgi:hypothetical protein
MHNSGKLFRAMALALVMTGVFGMRSLKADSGAIGGPSVSSCAFAAGIAQMMPANAGDAFLALWKAILGCSF